MFTQYITIPPTPNKPKSKSKSKPKSKSKSTHNKTNKSNKPKSKSTHNKTNKTNTKTNPKSTHNKTNTKSNPKSTHNKTNKTNTKTNKTKNKNKNNKNKNKTKKRQIGGSNTESLLQKDGDGREQSTVTETGQPVVFNPFSKTPPPPTQTSSTEESVASDNDKLLTQIKTIIQNMESNENSIQSATAKLSKLLADIKPDESLYSDVPQMKPVQGTDPFISAKKQGDKYQTQVKEDLELANKRIQEQEEKEQDTEEGYTRLGSPSDVDSDGGEEEESEEEESEEEGGGGVEYSDVDA